MDTWLTALGRVESGRDAQSLAVYGARGMGKTSLLWHLGKVARDLGWMVGELNASRDRPLELSLARGFSEAGIQLPDAGSRATSDKGYARVAILLDSASKEVQRRGAKLALLIDDADRLRYGEASALLEAVGRKRGSAAIVGCFAGDFGLVRILGDARSNSERLLKFIKLNALSRNEAALALTDPAKSQGILWDRQALDVAVDASAGIPRRLQMIGESIWRAADGNTVTLSAAQAGLRSAREEAAYSYSRDWRKLTDSERDVLTLVAQASPEGIAIQELAAQIGEIGREAQARILRLGRGRVVFTDESGVVTFEDRWFGDYIRSLSQSDARRDVGRSVHSALQGGLMRAPGQSRELWQTTRGRFGSL